MDRHVPERLINLLGALAVGVNDRMHAAIAQAMPDGGETVAALVAIGHAPRMTIDQLSRVLKLTHGGAVRLVDRLMEHGLVEKQRSPTDRRAFNLVLTSSAEIRREQVLAHRRKALAWAIAHVPNEHLAAFESVAEALVGALADDALSALTTCRYCDERRCVSCPMEAFGTIANHDAKHTERR